MLWCFCYVDELSSAQSACEFSWPSLVDGSLQRLAEAITGWGDEETALFDLCRQVASGVAHLHSMLCIHRDLVARNVLLMKVPVTEAANERLSHHTTHCELVAKLADVVCYEQRKIITG